MSADNYMLIRPHGGKFVVTMEFASDDAPEPVEKATLVYRGYTRVFDTIEEARDYAYGKRTEYGVTDETETGGEIEGSEGL